MSEILLSGSGVDVRVRPAQGGRIQSIVDRTSGRELLYQREPDGAASGFIEASTGGWDEMFPNDAPWDSHPDHGIVWSTPFSVVRHDTGSAELAAALPAMGVMLRKTVAVLPEPRRGIRVELDLRAMRATGPFMWTSHPMLAVAPGWRVDPGPGLLRADSELHGRHAPSATVAAAPPVPAPDGGWVEVVYAFGRTSAAVQSPDGSAVSRLAWDRSFLPYLWIVTVTGEADLDLCVLLEPSTARAWRMEDAIENGTAVQLAAGERRAWWVELESLDLPRTAASPRGDELLIAGRFEASAR